MQLFAFCLISEAKLKESNEPQIRKIHRHDNFIEHMNDTEKAAWDSVKETVEHFLDNKKIENCK